MNYRDAIISIELLSKRFPNKIIRLYETISGNYWIRFDHTICDEIDGIELTHIVAYKNGKPLDCMED